MTGGGSGAGGPGAYEKSTADHSMLSGTNDHRRSSSDSGAPNGKGNQNFLSTTKREDHWINRMDAPYTHPTNFQNPGPGKYNHEKKKDDIKAKILLEETVHIPFGTSEERACNKPHPKTLVPGPGTYIDPLNPHNSSVAKPLLKFSSDRTFAEAHGIKLGAFGSNAKRFDRGLFDGKNGPGPGQYDNLAESAIAEAKQADRSKLGSAMPVDQERPMSQSVFFKSTTDRFAKIDTANPNIRILEVNGKGRKTVS